MFILLDHDNFDKCRKALIISSVMLIVACVFKFNISDIDFYGLKLSASKQEYLILGVAGVTYFLWLFFIHTLDIIFKEMDVNDNVKIAMIKKGLSDDLDEFSGVDSTSRYIPDEGELIIRDHASYSINKIDKIMKLRVDGLKILKLYGGNLIPPYLFSIFALYKAIILILA